MMGNSAQLYFSNIGEDAYFHNTVSIFLKEIYNLMKNCYGPYGSHILINTGIRPEATKDGKTILSKVKTNGSISSAIHGSIISVADKQVAEVGDGSTTTVLLLCKLYEKFRTIINENNISPSEFNKSLRVVVDNLITLLKENAIPVVNDGVINFDKLYDAVYTSVDGDSELADTIISMFKELNCVEPLVLIEMSKSESHSYELVKGIETDGTIIRPDIFFGGYSRKEYVNPDILVINGRLDISLEAFCNIAEHRIRIDKDLIYLCTGINEDVLNNIVNLNNMNPGLFNRVAVFQIRQTAQNDQFLDLCAGIGGSPVDSDSLKRAINLEVLKKQIDVNVGTCAKALLTEFCARFNDPHANEEAVKQRLDIINEKIADLEKDSSSHNERIIDLESRKAFLSKNYAKFYVGGYSPQRKAINYELANDGIPQAISCMKHGITYGCNTAVPIILLNLKHSINNMTNLEKLIYDAIYTAYNDLHVQLIVNKTNDANVALGIVQHALNGELNKLNLRDNDSRDVINSSDTDRAILQNSTDMASLIATTKGFISQNNEFDVVSKGYQLGGANNAANNSSDSTSSI